MSETKTAPTYYPQPSPELKRSIRQWETRANSQFWTKEAKR